MERSNIQSLRQVIDKFLKETPLHKKLLERRIIEGWDEVMGKAVAQATGKRYINDGTLYIHLSSSVLRNELFMMKDSILAKLNRYAGEEVIRDVVFK
jgi:predicted nucleic acid-binding Zn ribbon protein